MKKDILETLFPVAGLRTRAFLAPPHPGVHVLLLLTLKRWFHNLAKVSWPGRGGQAYIGQEGEVRPTAHAAASPSIHNLGVL